MTSHINGNGNAEGNQSPQLQGYNSPGSQISKKQDLVMTTPNQSNIMMNQIQKSPKKGANLRMKDEKE